MRQQTRAARLPRYAGSGLIIASPSSPRPFATPGPNRSAMTHTLQPVTRLRSSVPSSRVWNGTIAADWRISRAFPRAAETAIVNQKQPADAIGHGQRVRGCTGNVTRADDRNCGHGERRRSFFRFLLLSSCSGSEIVASTFRPEPNVNANRERRSEKCERHVYCIKAAT